MRFLNYIQEEYLGVAKRREFTYDMFVNPDSKEIREVDKGEGIRFIADKKTKSLYIADYSFIHPLFLQHLMDTKTIDVKQTSWQDFISGTRFLMGRGKAVKGKIKITGGSLDLDTPPNPLKNFAWVKNYFTNFEEYYKNEIP